MCTSCAYKLSISHHTLLVIAVDGCPVEPTRVNSIDMYGGNAAFEVLMVASCGLCLRAGIVRTEVSEERASSISRVEIIHELSSHC
jgi:hypothetical protein